MPKTGKPHDPMKIRRTDEAIARLRQHAPHQNNRGLALTLGDPEYCSEAGRVPAVPGGALRVGLAPTERPRLYTVQSACWVLLPRPPSARDE
jgi:hypothetical protein